MATGHEGPVVRDGRPVTADREGPIASRSAGTVGQGVRDGQPVATGREGSVTQSDHDPT